MQIARRCIKKIFNITNHQDTANQNLIYYYKITNTGDDVEKLLLEL